MQSSAAFWAAFWGGLAAPVLLYTPPAPYEMYFPSGDVRSAFASVGAELTRIIGYLGDGGEQREGLSSNAASTSDI
jgi:hypothetical protein